MAPFFLEKRKLCVIIYATNKDKNLDNLLNVVINKKKKGKVTSGEVGLPMKNSDLILPCGIYGRWEREDE